MLANTYVPDWGDCQWRGIRSDELSMKEEQVLSLRWRNGINQICKHQICGGDQYVTFVARVPSFQALRIRYIIRTEVLSERIPKGKADVNRITSPWTTTQLF